MTVLERRASPGSPFFKLPPELRNRVYEFVFNITSEETIRVTDAFSPPDPSRPNAATSLHESAPPSIALICCCQTIHEESKGLFTEASKRYWKKEFVLELEQIRHIPVFKCLIDSIPARKMHKLVVVANHERQGVQGTQRFALRRDRNGHWHREWVGPNWGFDASRHFDFWRGGGYMPDYIRTGHMLGAVLRHYEHVTPRVEDQPVLYWYDRFLARGGKAPSRGGTRKETRSGIHKRGYSYRCRQ